jgi:peptide/nickel transport system substrate-binding protein
MSDIQRSWRRTSAVLLLIALLVPVIAACGGAPAAQTPTAAPAAQATTAPAAEPTTAPAAEPTTAPAAEPTTAPAASGSAGPNASAGNPEPGTAGGTMTGAWIGPCCVSVDNANPLKAGGDYHWLNKIYSHLVTYDLGYTQVVPDLAEKWAVASDNLNWTFNLRPGVKWHDGSDFTADDAIFSIELCLDPKIGGCDKSGQLSAITGAKDYADGKATSVAGLKAVDANTLQITTDAPNASLLDTLAETWIVQKASLGSVPRDQVGKSDYWTTKAIGTGPFKFSNYQAGQFMELVRFDDYFRGAPLLEKLIRREFKDPATALLAFDNGEIDFTYLTADEVERAMQNTDATVIPGPSQVDNAITMNPAKNPAFGNPKFRQAILHAINRQAIIENLYKGAAKPVSCLYGNEKYIPADIDPYEYDPEKAKALLAEAGIDPASLGEIVMDTYYNDPLSLDVMTAFQQDLAAVGINIKIQQMDGPSWTKRYYDDLQSEMSFIGGANGPDPNRAFQYFHTETGRGNNYKYSNPEFDKLLEQGAAEMDAGKRGAIYQQACTIMSQDLPWTFMWETVRYGYVSNKIGNFLFTPAPGGGSYYDQAEKWFIRQ